MELFRCYDNSDVIATLMMTNFHLNTAVVAIFLDCKTGGFFLKISKEIGNAWHKSLTCVKRAILQTFCLTARMYLNTQKYGLFCSLQFFQMFVYGDVVYAQTWY